MQFCISDTIYFEQYGFNTNNWRKNIDGSKAIVHIEYAKLLIPNIETDLGVQIYNAPSQELDNILSSSEWTSPETVVE